MAPPITFRYQLVHLVYVVTYLGANLGMFGLVGLLPAIAVLAFWGYVYSQTIRPRALAMGGVALAITQCFCCVMLPVTNGMWLSEFQRQRCSANLTAIGYALQNYHDVYGEYPPAYAADDTGKPMHSWRVLLLPFVEQRQLWNEYRLNEPWDGPNNIKLLDRMPACFACPSGTNRAGYTNYMAIVGPEAAWLGDESRGHRDFERPFETIVLVETHQKSARWTEPVDVSVDEAIAEFTDVDGPAAGHPRQSFLFEYGHDTLCGCGDISVHTISSDASANVLRSLMMVTKGSNHHSLRDLLDSRNSTWHSPRLRIGNCLRLVAWILLTMLPLGWVWRERHGAGRGSNHQSMPNQQS